MALQHLPDPRRERLPQAPVELVIWQVQFAEPTDVSSPTVGTTLADHLAADPAGPFHLQRLATPVLPIPFQALAPGAEQTQVDGWTLRRGTLAVTVNRQSLSVETTVYEDWYGFRRIVELALHGLAEAILLPGEQRLGLRYVDRITHPGVREPADWAGLIAPWLSGPLQHPQLSEAIDAYAQQVDFNEGEGGLRAAVRQHVFADVQARGRQTAILDFDIYRTGYRLIEPEPTLQASDQMSDLAHRLFEAAITETLYDAFASESEGR